jgi:hypothetical protein
VLDVGGENEEFGWLAGWLHSCVKKYLKFARCCDVCVLKACLLLGCFLLLLMLDEV